MIGYSRIGMILAVAGLSATAGAALWDRHRPAPTDTLVMLSACGLVPAPEPVSLPLASLFAGDAPNLATGLSLGPIRHPGLDAPLWVRFEAHDIPATGPDTEPDTEPHTEPDTGPDTEDEGPLRHPALRPHMDDTVLVVPLLRGAVPDAIRLACRHGHVAEVRHHHAGNWHHLPVDPDPLSAPAGAGTDTDPDQSGRREPSTPPLAHPATGGDTEPGTSRNYTATIASD